MEPLLVSLDKSTEVFPLFQHTGIEMLYMLDGVMEYSYGRERYRMEKGDTLQFEGDIPHGPTQLIKTPIHFLSITVVRRRPLLTPGAPRPAHGTWRWPQRDSHDGHGRPMVPTGPGCLL